MGFVVMALMVILVSALVTSGELAYEENHEGFCSQDSLAKGTELRKHTSTSKMVFYHTQILDIYYI